MLLEESVGLKKIVFLDYLVIKREHLKEIKKFTRISRKDTIFDFEINDLAPVNYIAETLTYGQLNKFIYEEKKEDLLL